MKAEMPFGAAARLGDRHHHHDVAHAAVRREGLRAVQHPTGARADGGRPHAGGVAARRRLREAPGADLLAARTSGARKRCFCSSVPKSEMCEAQAVVRGHRERHAGVHARELLDADAVVDRGHRRAAVPLGNLNPEQAERRQLRHQLGREMLILIPLAHVGPDFGFSERANTGAEHRLLLGRTKVHVLKTVARTLRHNSGQDSDEGLSAVVWPNKVNRTISPVGMRRAILDEPSAQQARIVLPAHPMTRVEGLQRALESRQPVERHAGEIVVLQMVVRIQEREIPEPVPAHERAPLGRIVRVDVVVLAEAVQGEGDRKTKNTGTMYARSRASNPANAHISARTVRCATIDTRRSNAICRCSGAG